MDSDGLLDRDSAGTDNGESDRGGQASFSREQGIFSKERFMRRHLTWQTWIAAVTLVALSLWSVGPASAAGRKEKTTGDANAAGGANLYMPPDSFTTPIQLRVHIERLQKVPLTQRQAGYSEALVATADKILESKPPESLREFAVINLLDGLHHWADAEKNADADKRLTELATKYSKDANKHIAVVAAFYELEERVLKPNELKPEQVGKLLDEVKAALNGKSLTAKQVRIANGTVTLINNLDTDEEAEKRFKDFGRIFSTSTDNTIARLGNQIRNTTKRDLSQVKAAEKPAEAAPMPEPAAMPAHEPVVKVERAEDWIKRMEAKLPTISTPEHDAEYQKEKSAFFEKYSGDPLRWRWNIMDARRAVSSEGSREARAQRSRVALLEVISAGDAPEELREQASSMNVKLDIYAAAPVAELAQHVKEHLEKFPNSKLNSDLVRSVVASLGKGQTDEQTLARLEELKQCDVAPLAEAAGARIAELQKQSKAKSGAAESTAAATGAPKQ